MKNGMAGYAKKLTRPTALNHDNNETFTYDDLYRLVQAEGAYGTHAFTYDANGNRLTKTVDGQTDTYNYQPGTNRLASITGANPETFTYDQAGAMLSRIAQTYTQDQTGRMVEGVAGGQTTGYLINGFGERVVKNRASDAVVFHFDQDGQLIAESDQYGNTLKEYIYLGSTLVGLTDDGGTLHYVHTGYRDEPKAITNTAGTVIWSAVYAPYGKATVNEDPDGNGEQLTLNVRLPGQYYEAETGLHYNYMRNYAPDIGRFLSLDPIGFHGGDLNLYAYCWNDPVNWVDPTGQNAVGDWLDSAFDSIEVLYWGLGIAAAMSGLGSRISVVMVIMTMLLRWKWAFDIGVVIGEVVFGPGIGIAPTGSHTSPGGGGGGQAGGHGGVGAGGSGVDGSGSSGAGFGGIGALGASTLLSLLSGSLKRKAAKGIKHLYFNTSRQAMRAAKRDAKIPTSDNFFKRIKKNEIVDRKGGRSDTYECSDGRQLQHHKDGHDFPDGGKTPPHWHFGPHHYYYTPKNGK